MTFRANVGAVIADDAGRVLVFERSKIPGAWQFPQGGIQDDEDPAEAVLREIREETGIDPSDLIHVATHPEWLAYELPEADRSQKTGRGQVQKWFLFRLIADHQLELPTDQDAEFRAYEWVSLDEAMARIVSFKRPVYRRVAEAFRTLACGDQLTPPGREYLLTDFNHVTSSMLSNEEMGERRVVNFVTLIALLATAVGLASETLPEERADDVLWLSVAATVAALAFGLLTFLRILKRNVHTTVLQRYAQDFREKLSAGDPVAESVVPFDRPRDRELRWRKPGLAETVIVLNALLTSTGVALATTRAGLPAAWSVAIALGTFLLAGFGMDRWARSYYRARRRAP